MARGACAMNEKREILTDLLAAAILAVVGYICICLLYVL